MSTKSRTLAARLLDRAAGIVDGERRQQNGQPERSLSAIGDFWDVYLEHRTARFNGSCHPVDAVDVCNLMELLKIVRSLYGEPLPDHFVDRAGYAALAGEAELLAKREGDARPNGHAEPVGQVNSNGQPDLAAVVLAEIAAELARARSKFPPMRSPHEAWGIIAEEFAELTEEIRRRKPDRAAMRSESVQLAAMAIRFVLDVCLEPMAGTEAVPDAQLAEAFERVALKVSREAGGDITPAAAARYLRRRFADPATALEELESADSIDVIKMAEEIANQTEAAD